MLTAIDEPGPPPAAHQPAPAATAASKPDASPRPAATLLRGTRSWSFHHARSRLSQTDRNAASRASHRNTRRTGQARRERNGPGAGSVASSAGTAWSRRCSRTARASGSSSSRAGSSPGSTYPTRTSQTVRAVSTLPYRTSSGSPSLRSSSGQLPPGSGGRQEAR
ncbi:hypothetical protein ACFQ0B_73580 [Nonomuraea thailandensis]